MGFAQDMEAETIARIQDMGFGNLGMYTSEPIEEGESEDED